MPETVGGVRVADLAKKEVERQALIEKQYIVNPNDIKIEIMVTLVFVVKNDIGVISAKRTKEVPYGEQVFLSKQECYTKMITDAGKENYEKEFGSKEFGSGVVPYHNPIVLIDGTKVSVDVSDEIRDYKQTHRINEEGFLEIMGPDGIFREEEEHKALFGKGGKN